MRQRFSNIRWRLVAFGGAKATIIGIFSWVICVVLYAFALAISVHGQPDRTEIARFAAYGAWTVPILTVGVTHVVTRAVTRSTTIDTAAAHGTVIGALAGIFLLVVWTLAHGAPGLWTFAATLLCVYAGWRGGIKTSIALARLHHQYQASRAVATADTVQSVVEHVSVYLRETQVRYTSLWIPEQHTADGAPLTLRHVATWQDGAHINGQPEARLRHTDIPILGDLQPEKPLFVALSDRPSRERKAWEASGVQHPILLPLAGPDDRCTALVLMDWPTERAAKRSLNAVQAIAAQTALALENIRLIEQGRQVGVLEERQRLARDIHDTLAQGFTSIVMHLEAAEQSLPANTTTALSHLDLARRTARDSLSEARHVVWALRPDVLAHASLSEAIERVATQWSEEVSVDVMTTITGHARPLVVAIEATLLRVVQEALANVRKHATARRVMITLSFMDSTVALDVRDDGVGFDPCLLQRDEQYRASGYGLLAMRERVQACGGNMLIESVPGEGTTLAIELPAMESEQVLAGATFEEKR